MFLNDKKQIGVVMFGPSRPSTRALIEQYRSEGYRVLIYSDHLRLY